MSGKELKSNSKETSTAGELSRFPAGIETAHPGISGASLDLGEPGIGSAVLAHWARHPGSARSRKLGRQSHRPIGRGSEKGLPGDEGLLAYKSQIYMRAFAEAWPEEEFVQHAVALIPWGHNVRILDYLKDSRGREWYVRATLQHGWSRDVLVHQIESGLHKRAGAAVTNFERTLPPPQSDLAQQVTKDPYTFDFLMIGEDAHERKLEQGLLAHLRDFLLELGVGFAFVASQYRLEVSGSDFFIDLLFYHLKLRCYVVIDQRPRHSSRSLWAR
jgi:predicted nuclease of restriction endonuclease-like (RecB) superfamily